MNPEQFIQRIEAEQQATRKKIRRTLQIALGLAIVGVVLAGFTLWYSVVLIQQAGGLKPVLNKVWCNKPECP